MRLAAALLLNAGLMAASAHAETTLPKGAQQISPPAIGGRYLTVAKVSGSESGVVQVAVNATYQWPGTYFEAAFTGDTVFAKFSDSANIFNVLIDGKLIRTLNRPGNVTEPFKDLGQGQHVIRIERLTETQDLTGTFEGFFVPKGKALAIKPRPRQIEFIGDSSSVGYGNTSTTRKCTKEEIWATTDTSQAYPIMTAKHYDADYQLNAFSGRGIVRNYDGVAAGAPLPVLYPYILFDRKTEYSNPTWQPQIIVIGLGGNDFSTPVHVGEKWSDQDALKADFEASYVAFVKTLRAKNPKAFFILTSNDGAIVDTEVAKVAAKLKADGETRLDYIGMKDFGRNGCDWHFDLNDHKKIFGIFTAYLDAHPELWQ